MIKITIGQNCFRNYENWKIFYCKSYTSTKKHLKKYCKMVEATDEFIKSLLKAIDKAKFNYQAVMNSNIYQYEIKDWDDIGYWTIENITLL